MRALQLEATTKQRTGRDWIGGVAVVGTAVATVAALALAARRRKRRDEVRGAHVTSEPSGASGASGIAGPTATALAALHTTRDAMNKAKREMIEASEACLPALITYAERLGEHKAYKEAHKK